MSIQTELQRGNPVGLQEKREKRILEALSWQGGVSPSQPNKYVVARLPTGSEVYFLKPGKEVSRSKPNPHDMNPCVGEGVDKYSFDDIWKQLSRTSVHDFEAFRSVLALIYRNAYMLDHKETDAGKIRYSPSRGVMDAIGLLDRRLEGHIEYGLLGFLHFIDILGWNEDVKYHVEGGKPVFTGDHGWRVGRINTLLTCINVPYKTYKAVEDIIKNSSTPDKIDWSLVYDTMQLLVRTRGVCTPKQEELPEILAPYLINSSTGQKRLG